MLIMRFALIVAVLVLVVSGGMYLFTGRQRYLKFAWQVVRLMVVLVLLFGLLYLLERYVLVAWRVFL
jgi:hypothetical protein